jgi:chromosome segregation protein
VRLKSLTLKGFKSFPDRTRLDFGEGVSVVVGPNGSGKSNITDAVLWAMGEQSPLAVRGQSMQDVIFGGGRGVQARAAAEVEIVLDNSDGTVELPLSEISISRRLERNGEGGYRLNGARCRLTDVIEVLSDTGLGKETHSVISQGRVDAIVTSRPRDRRLLIEEAAGLGKHRKRRRRAQLKLERTEENLDRALDVEREARTRLRPLKRQAEAAQLHERLERQILEARLELARDALRSRRVELDGAESDVARARAERERIERTLQATVDRRGGAERALSERAERHDALARRLYDARSAEERLQLRGEQAAAARDALVRRSARVELELSSMGADSSSEAHERAGAHDERLARLEAQLAEIDARHEQQAAGEIAELERERERRAGALADAERAAGAARDARDRAEAVAREQREALAAAEHGAHDARRELERLGAELAAANQFLRAHARTTGEGSSAPRALSDDLHVQDGYELALAAALGGRLDAALAADVPDAQKVLDGTGEDGGAVLLENDARPPAAGAPAVAPAAGARRLLELLSGSSEAMALAERLLDDAWVVQRLEDLPADFGGIAATREGRVWFAGWGELRQLAPGGGERMLVRRNERDRLQGAVERATGAEQAAQADCERALGALRAAELAAADAGEVLRAAERELVEVAEAARGAEWLLEQRRAAPAQGELAVRRAEIEGALAVERRLVEERERERTRREQEEARLRAQHELDTLAAPAAERLVAAIATTGELVGERVAHLARELDEDRAAGEAMTAELRACAAEEAEIQTRLRACGERVTAAEVAAQRIRDHAAEAELELTGVAEQLGADGGAGGEGSEDEGGESPAPAELDEEEREVLSARVQRLNRRREQLGPVNPLAQEEYGAALAHVEELERQRGDLETAMRELRSVIRETDRQIQQTFEETFAAAARNFEELVRDVFPGGSGRLRLVDEERSPSPVLGGQMLPGADGGGGEDGEAAAEEEAEAELRAREEEALPGVEIELTPAGKATKRLSLLSGGEKSMTALAFLFAVFLARPCPFYILDEVEAALDDLNLDRFLALLRRYADQAQFIVITHQKRTMEAADWLYGVSMGGDGVSKVISRRLPAPPREVAEVA